ncbi:15909_t:CDS:1, partial [Gigaspora rosea]
SHIDILLDHCDAPLENLLMTVEDYNSDFIDALIRFCERKKTLNCVNIGRLDYSCSLGTTKERFSCYSVINDEYWEEIKNDLEGHAELVTYESLLVNLFE